MDLNPEDFQLHEIFGLELDFINSASLDVDGFDDRVLNFFVTFSLVSSCWITASDQCICMIKSVV